MPQAVTRQRNHAEALPGWAPEQGLIVEDEVPRTAGALCGAEESVEEFRSVPPGTNGGCSHRDESGEERTLDHRPVQGEQPCEVAYGVRVIVHGEKRIDDS